MIDKKYYLPAISDDERELRLYILSYIREKYIDNNNANILFSINRHNVIVFYDDKRYVLSMFNYSHCLINSKAFKIFHRRLSILVLLT